jgi:cytochrome c oxidase subunit 1
MYLALVTIHGTIMVFFVLTAGLSGTFSNLLIPLQIGARDMASGFLNMVSYWLFFLSSIIMVISLFVEAGPAAAGWTIYPPLSALPQAIPGSGAGMTLWLVSMAIFIASSLIGSLNYIVTIFNLRTKGMKMTRLPLTMWHSLSLQLLGLFLSQYYYRQLYCWFSTEALEPLSSYRIYSFPERSYTIKEDPLFYLNIYSGF